MNRKGGYKEAVVNFARLPVKSVLVEKSMFIVISTMCAFVEIVVMRTDLTLALFKMLRPLALFFFNSLYTKMSILFHSLGTKNCIIIKSLFQ
jgi:hypothetical protein